jgi:hypothetical protein
VINASGWWAVRPEPLHEEGNLSIMLIKIRREPKPIGVPYGRPQEELSSHSYINLRQFPEGIDDIPEVRDWPELRATLVDLNRSGSAFQTLGCEKMEIEEQGAHSVSGYVQICFENLSKAKDEKFYTVLFNRFYRHAETGWPDNLTHVIFEIQPTIFIELGALSCLSISFWLIVVDCGSAVEAKEKWSGALKFFREFLLAESAILG